MINKRIQQTRVKISLLGYNNIFVQSACKFSLKVYFTLHYLKCFYKLEKYFLKEKLKNTSK